MLNTLVMYLFPYRSSSQKILQFFLEAEAILVPLYLFLEDAFIFSDECSASSLFLKNQVIRRPSVSTEKKSILIHCKLNVQYNQIKSYGLF